jgi:hypothetical protein
VARTEKTAESVSQYIARIERNVAGKDPLAILRKTPNTLTRAVEAATRSRLTARPAPGKWSAGEILAHLSELEILWGCRLRLILGQTGVPIVGMDQDVWARNSAYRTIDPRRALSTFAAIRRANPSCSGASPPRSGRRWGAHSQFGQLTITRLTQLLAGHDVNHVRQIEERLPEGLPGGRPRRRPARPPAPLATFRGEWTQIAEPRNRAGGGPDDAPELVMTRAAAAPSEGGAALRIRTLPIFLAFFVMGFVDAVGTLVGFAKTEFRLTGFEAGLLPFFGFVAFALFSVPAGVVAERRGKRFLLLLSLGVVLAGQLFASAARYACFSW